jgi:hypothetical protein
MFLDELKGRELAHLLINGKPYAALVWPCSDLAEGCELLQLLEDVRAGGAPASACWRDATPASGMRPRGGACSA